MENFIETFSTATLEQMYQRAPFLQRIENRKVIEERDLTEATTYIKKYFFPLKSGGCMVYDKYSMKIDKEWVDKWQFFYYPKETLYDVYLKKFPEELRKWYNNKFHNLYEIINDLKLPLISGNKINMCKNFLHKSKPYSLYPEQIRDGVQMMLNHIKEVISSNNEALFKYVINWLAKMCQGGKNSTILYLKSIGGTGKSTFTDFIFFYVLGIGICLKANVEVLTTQYNKALCGVLLALFEELPTFNESQWHYVSGKLKDLATGTQMSYTEKYEKSFQAENLTNIIINTNVDALKADRRICWLDISIARLKDYDYFSKLRNICFNKEVGEAFFSYLCEVDVSEFQEERDMPETKAKLNSISSRLESPFQYVKEMFILKQKQIKASSKQFFLDYCDYCNLTHKKAYGRNEFWEKLKEINILKKKSNGQNKVVVSLETLNEMAEKRRWINEHDEYEQIEEEEDEIDDENTIVINPKKYHKILKQMKKLFPNLKL